MTKTKKRTNTTGIPKFRNTINANQIPRIRETNLDNSLTEPNMALTIPEMIRRYATGRPISVKVYDDFGGDEDHLTGVDIRTLDLSQIAEMRDQMRENLEKLNREQMQRQHDMKMEALEKSIIEKYEARKKPVEEIEKPGKNQLSLDLPKPGSEA